MQAVALVKEKAQSLKMTLSPSSVVRFEQVSATVKDRVGAQVRLVSVTNKGASVEHFS